MRSSARVLLSVAARVVLCLLCSLVDSPAIGDEEPAADDEQRFYEKVNAALAQPADWDFDGEPLLEVTEDLAHELGIDVLLDERAVDGVGLGRWMPIAFKQRGVSRRVALRRLLESRALGFYVEHQTLWITSKERAENKMFARVYPVGDLFASDDAGTALREAIGAIFAERPQVGPAALAMYHSNLVVYQTLYRHEEVEHFLIACRRLTAKQTSSPHDPIFLGPAAHDKLRAAMFARVNGRIYDAPLREVIADLGRQAGIDIVFDKAPLEDVGIDPDQPVTAAFVALPLKDALGRVLDNLDLKYLIRDEAIYVTTPEVAESHLTAVLYPVGDLLDGNSNDPRTFDFDLIHAIETTIAPDTWPEGNKSSIATLPTPVPCLVIAQTEEVHDQIASLLAQLRRAKPSVPEHATDELQTRIHFLNTAGETVAAADIVRILQREFGNEIWTVPDGVYIDTLGPFVIVRHQAEVQRRIADFLLGLNVSPHSGGFF